MVPAITVALSSFPSLNHSMSASCRSSQNLSVGLLSGFCKPPLLWPQLLALSFKWQVVVNDGSIKTVDKFSFSVSFLLYLTNPIVSSIPLALEWCRRWESLVSSQRLISLPTQELCCSLPLGQIMVFLLNCCWYLTISFPLSIAIKHPAPSIQLHWDVTCFITEQTV